MKRWFIIAASAVFALWITWESAHEQGEIFGLHEAARRLDDDLTSAFVFQARTDAEWIDLLARQWHWKHDPRKMAQLVFVKGPSTIFIFRTDDPRYSSLLLKSSTSSNIVHDLFDVDPALVWWARFAFVTYGESSPEIPLPPHGLYTIRTYPGPALAVAPVSGP